MLPTPYLFALRLAVVCCRPRGRAASEHLPDLLGDVVMSCRLRGSCASARWMMDEPMANGQWPNCLRSALVSTCEW
eukprot:scaffold148066_cov34-Tisochrysis_lutea.AAC.1